MIELRLTWLAHDQWPAQSHTDLMKIEHSDPHRRLLGQAVSAGNSYGEVMFEMRSEGSPVIGGDLPMWHVVRPDDSVTALCGLLLDPKADPDRDRPTPESPTEPFCITCMIAMLGAR